MLKTRSLQELEFLTKQLVAPAAENYGQPIVLVDGRCEDQTCKYESGTSQQAGLLFPKKLLEGELLCCVEAKTDCGSWSAVKNRNGKCLVISNDSDHPLSRSDCKVSFLIKEQSPKCELCNVLVEFVVLSFSRRHRRQRTFLSSPGMPS